MNDEMSQKLLEFVRKVKEAEEFYAYVWAHSCCSCHPECEYEWEMNNVG